MEDPDASPDLGSLATFLERPDRPQDGLILGEVYGFLFAVACSPELVPPSEWIPRVFGGAGPAFATARQAQTVIAALMHVYNRVTELARLDDPRLPDECRLLPDPMANLAPESAIAAWSRGFREGHGWLEEVWDAPMPEEMDRELAASLVALTFFGLGDEAEAVTRELMPGGSATAAARTMHKVFPDAVAEYGRMGRVLEEAFRRERAHRHRGAQKRRKGKRR
jgi:uncharacterized protein